MAEQEVDRSHNKQQTESREVKPEWGKATNSQSLPLEYLLERLHDFPKQCHELENKCQTPESVGNFSQSSYHNGYYPIYSQCHYQLELIL